MANGVTEEKKKSRFGLAVSGGSDSTALLVMFAMIRKQRNLELEVLHVDHGIRRDSGEDRRFVQKLAKRYGLKFHALTTKVRAKKGESIEMAARRVRLAYFAEMTKKLKLDCVMTAHNMDDVAETFLMRLARASGAEGLAGLKPISRVDGVTFVRPLLDFRKSELQDFLTGHGIGWREDSTNDDTSILRNKVRHVILPFLKKNLDSRIVEHIWKSAEYLRELVDAKPECVYRKTKKECRHETERAADEGFVLKMSDAIGYETNENRTIGELPAVGYLSRKALKGRELDVRAWKAGDRMQPCGFAHHRKLQDIFVTAKVPSNVRKTLPVLAWKDSNEVLWIPGYRVAESVKAECMDAPTVRLELFRKTIPKKREI